MSCKHFLVVEEKNVRRLMRDDGCTLLTKKFVRRPSDVGQGMLVCGSVAVDLSELVLWRFAYFSNRTIMT